MDTTIHCMTVAKCSTQHTAKSELIKLFLYCNGPISSYEVNDVLRSSEP